MNSSSIARWLTQIGLPQYSRALEKHIYGLEGLLLVTEDDLRLMGVEDPDHRTTIINQLQKQQQRIQPEKESNSALTTGTMSHKLSLASSLDLVKPTTDLFRHSIVPRLRRRDNHRVSASCLQLPSHTCDEDHAPSTKHKLRFPYDHM